VTLCVSFREGEKGRRMTRSDQERLAKDISAHQGQWVLVRGSRVVAASSSIREAVNSLPPAERKKVRAQFCPRDDYSGASFSAL
jgi:hypothetical protein